MVLPTQGLADDTGKRREVLVLHSYSPDYPWAQSEQSGIDSVFHPLALHYKLRIEYLDSTHNPQLLKGVLLRQLFRQKYSSTPFEVIIAADNAALEFLRKHREAIFPGVPVVFSGINGFNPSMIEGMSKVTGVAEDNDFLGVFNLLVNLHPRTKSIVIYGIPDDPSHKANVAAIRTILPGFRGSASVEVREFRHIEACIADAKTLPPDSAVLIVGNMRNVAGVGINLQRATEILSSEIAAPIYTAWDFGVGHGAVGGYVLSGFEQGRLAADLAMRILQGEQAARIPVIRNAANYYLFDYRQLARFGIRPNQVPPGSRILNLPEEGYRVRKELLWAVVFSLALLTATVVILAVNMRTRKRVEKALAASEEKYSTAFRNSADVVGIARLSDGMIVEVSDAFYRTFGYSSREIIGKISGVAGQGMGDSFGLWQNGDARKALYEILRAGEPVRNLEVAWCAKNGDVFVGLYSAEIIRIGGEPCIIFVWHDISERKQAEEKRQELEERLRQAQKIESIGMLAGGVAHDFNNLLTPIIGYSEILLSRMDESDRTYGSVLEIKRAAKRAAELTRQLLAFSRKQVLELKVLDLGLVIERFEQMLRRTIREDVRIEVLISPDLSLVQADRGQIEQVLMNLAVNAQDAMPNGGTMTIEAKNVVLDGAYVTAHPDAAIGPHVELSLTDTGTGMDESVLEHLFEPFFTTKEEGKGTGLGLSTVYGIVKQHGGSLSVDSHPGKGSVFHVYLPCVLGGDAAAVPSPAETPAAHLPRGAELVLLVEDNEIVRNLAIEMLHLLGYHVLPADGPESCFSLFEQHRDEIDMLLTDVIMPVMNGKQLYDRLAAKRPDLKVLFMSGHASDVIGLHGVLEDDVHFIQKPLSLQPLAEKIRSVLDA